MRPSRGEGRPQKTLGLSWKEIVMGTGAAIQERRFGARLFCRWIYLAGGL